MKKFYLLLFIFAISQIAIIAKGPVDGTIVSTFYLTFPPAYQESDADSLKASVLISSFSNSETNVAITINSRNYRKEITLAPFASEEVFFDVADAFPVQRKVTDTIAYENIYPQSGIKIEADNNVNCYGFVKSSKINEGFLVYPLEALNKYYIVSTQTSHDHKAPAYSAIVGVYDNTKVTFRIGGCIDCKTIGYDGTHLIAGKIIRRTINEGDVWLVPGIGDYNDLSGSVVNASKPVAVISGNYHVNNNENTKKYNYLIEQDIPNSLYGNKFCIDNIKGSKKNPRLRIYPKEQYTIIYANGKPIDTLITPGGVINDGFADWTPNGEFAPPLVISSDSAHPINVVLFNQDSGDYSYPFKMQLVPEDRFNTSVGFQFPNYDNYKFNSSLIYKPYKGKIPETFQVLKIIDNKYMDSSYTSYFGEEIGIPFPKFDDKEYFSRIINFNKNDKYAFVEMGTFVNYIYGGNDKYAFGFPTKMDYRVKTRSDQLLPNVSIIKNEFCGNIILGTVQDIEIPGNETNANLVKIYMDKNFSYNFNFTFNKFELGTFENVNWQLNVIDPTKDAYAKLVFIDRSGNITNERLEFKARRIDILDSTINFGKFIEIDSTKENIKLFTIKNNSKFDYLRQFWKIYPILHSTYNNQESNFELLNVKDISPLNINQEKSFEVKFKNIQNGHSIDSLGIVLISNTTQDTCLVKFFTELSADVYQVFMQADGVDFGEQIINSEVIGKTLTLTNPNQSPFISELPIQIVGYETSGDSIGDANSNKIFKILDLNKITEKNPITIEVGGKYELNVQFRPDSAKEYKSYIKFKVKTDISPIFIDTPFQEAIITGIGKIGTSVIENTSSDVVISPNPAGEYITINFRSIGACSDDNGASPIASIEIYDVMGIKIQTAPFETKNFSSLQKIDVSNLATGVYFVKIGGSNGACSIVEKFVKI